MESGPMLQHIAFFAELSEADESDGSWRELAAGLVVLRLVDSWLHNASVGSNNGNQSLNAIRSAIDEIDGGRPVRGILHSIVDTIERAPCVDARVVSPRMLAYGTALEYDGRWALAVDVYETVIAHAHPIEDSESATRAHLRLGYCLLVSNELDDAGRAYEMANTIALAANDMVSVLRARLGEAKLATARGNLPRAEAILDQAIVDANEVDSNGLQSMLLHDRSSVAYLRGNPELAIQFAYRALEHTSTQRERDRILLDIALMFYKLGARSTARDAYLVLSATAQEQYVRWNADISLMTIAAEDGSEPVFERYRRDLEAEHLSPLVEAEFNLRAGESYWALGAFAHAETWVERSVALARDARLNQLEFEADGVLTQLRAARRRSVAEQYEVAPELDTIVTALQQLRVTAESGV